MFKRDVDTDEYKDSYGEMQNWYDIYNNKGNAALLLFLWQYLMASYIFLWFVSEISKLESSMTAGETVEMLNQKQMDVKVFDMLKEIFSNFLVVFVMMCVAYVSHDPQMYYQNVDLKMALVDNAPVQVSL